MNTDYNSKAMRYVRNHGFYHAHDIATEYAEESVGYHYCFPDGYRKQYDEGPFETAIDHIYICGKGKKLTVCKASVALNYHPTTHA